MVRRSIIACSLGFMVACGGAGEAADDGESSAKVEAVAANVLGEIAPDDLEFARGLEKGYRAYAFEVVDERVQFMTAEVSGGAAPEAVILDERGTVVAKSVRNDENLGTLTVTRASIASITFPMPGRYLLAFREAGEGSTDRSVEVRLGYDLAKVPQTTFTCKTSEALGEGREEFSFSLAFAEHEALAPYLVPFTEDDTEYYVHADESGYVSLLNENTTFSTGDGKMAIHGDGDGISLVDLVLYKDAKYEKGFVRVTYEGASYSNVSCGRTPN
jgi:hypothetical protein